MEDDKPSLDNPDSEQSSDVQPEVSNTSEVDIPAFVPDHTSSGKFKRFAMSLLVLILIFLGLASLYYLKHKAPTVKKVHVTTSLGVYSPLLTYVSTASPKTFMVTNANQKPIVTIKLSPGEESFGVMAKNNKDVLVGESSSTLNSGPSLSNLFYLISSSGTVTKLSPVDATVLNSIKVTGAYFGPNNDLLYVSCSSTSCSLNDLNLITPSVKTLLNNPYNPTGSPSVSSLALLGVVNSMAYLQNIQTLPGNIEEVSLNPASAMNARSLPMMTTSLNAPVLSPDGSRVIYSDQANDGHEYVMNLSSGQTSVIVTGLSPDSEDFSWSPDSLTVAYTVNNQGFSTNSSVASIAKLVDLNVVSAKAVLLKSFGSSSYNEIVLHGWGSVNQLYYSVAVTQTANNFSNAKVTDYQLNLRSNSTTQTDPVGYRMFN